MFRKSLKLILIGMLVPWLCGCIAVMASLSESAKAKQQVELPYGQALETIKEVIKAQNIEFISADIRGNIAEVKGRYSGEMTVCIFVTKVNDSLSEIAVRAGVSDAGKKYAEQILQAIVDYAAQHRSGG